MHSIGQWSFAQVSRMRFVPPYRRKPKHYACGRSDSRVGGPILPNDKWSGRWESNPRLKLGKLGYYHYTTPARGNRISSHLILVVFRASRQIGRRSKQLAQSIQPTSRKTYSQPIAATSVR